MTTKHAKLKSALTRAIIDFFLREDLYADELSIQGTVCITADRTSTFVTQITETITDGDVTITEIKNPQYDNRKVISNVTKRPGDGTAIVSSSWHGSSTDARRGDSPWIVNTPGVSRRVSSSDQYSPRPQDLSKETADTVDANIGKSSSVTNTGVHHFGKTSDLLPSVEQFSPKASRKDINANTGIKTPSGLDSLRQLADFATNLRFDRNSSITQDKNPGISPTLENLSKTLFAGRETRRESSGSTSSSFSLPSVQDEPLSKRSRLDSDSIGHVGNTSRQNAPYRFELPKASQLERQPSLDDQECVLVIDENSDKQSIEGNHDRINPIAHVSKFPCLPSSASNMASASSSQFSPLSDASFSQNLSHALTKYTNMLPNHTNQSQQSGSQGDSAMLRQQVFEEMALAASWQAMSGFHGDEGSENTSNEWTRKARTKFSPEQLQALEEEYARDPFLSVSSERRAQLAQKLNITERNVQIWFQNQRRRRRAREYCAFTYKPETAASSSNQDSTSITFDSLVAHGNFGNRSNIVSPSSSGELSSYCQNEPLNRRSSHDYPAFMYKPDVTTSGHLSQENLSSTCDSLTGQGSPCDIVSPSYRGDTSSFSDNETGGSRIEESSTNNGQLHSDACDKDPPHSTQDDEASADKTPKVEPSNGHVTSCDNSL